MICPSGASMRRLRRFNAAFLSLLAAVLVTATLPLAFAAFASPSASAASPDKPAAIEQYTCPMHPHYISDDPGTCPICGMDLVPVSGGKGTGGSADSGDRQPGIVLPAETIQNMGVRTARAAKTSFGRAVRAYGVVKENERLQNVVNNRLEGWVEDLRIKAVGDPVKKGDLLYHIYSPELFVSQRDYLTTLQSGDRERQKAAGLRLRSYGVQPRAIQQLERQREAMMQMPFYAEEDGIVSKIDVQSGAFVGRGTMIAMIQDYSSVWLVVSVAEQDIAFLEQGSMAKVVFPTQQNREASARVDYIYPTIDAKSRTGQVRLVIDNKDGRLRPGTYADVVFEITSRDRLSVPSEALLVGTKGAHVILSKGEGRFEPRPVKTGLVVGERTEIIDGLASDDLVVVSGQFLLDSESALREGFNKMPGVDTPLSLLKLVGADLAVFDHLVDAALYLHEAQTDGYDAEPKFLDPARGVRNHLLPRFAGGRLAPVLDAADEALASAQKAQASNERLAALAALVNALKPWLLEGMPGHYRDKGLGLYEDQTSHRLWLQRGAKVANPYGRGKAKRLVWPATPPQPATGAPQARATGGGAHAHH